MTIPIPEGSVVITPMEVYREMLATHEAVRAVDAKFDAFRDEQARRMAEIDGPDGTLRDHEVRIRSLERFKWAITPVAMAVSGAVGAAVTKVMSGH